MLARTAVAAQEPNGPRDEKTRLVARPGGPAGVAAAGPALDKQMVAMRVQQRLFGGAAAAPRVGHYCLVRKLGEGGMGIVYVAIDTRLNREVALKLLHPTFTESEQGKLRLLREARVMATVSHPNVVGVYEVDETDGCVYISMELVRGITMRDWLATAQRPWTAIVDAFLQAGEGLWAAHRVALVHRDFKPDNIIVGKDGRVKVLDFGLAFRRLPQGIIDERRSGEPALDPGSTLTAPNTVMGTVAYMSPEQFEHANVDSRSDQFSFGVSLFEALFGHRPFCGRNLVEIRDNIRNHRLVVAPDEGRVPGWLTALLLKSLSVDPDQRYSSMGELTALLDAGLRAEKTSAPCAASVGFHGVPLSELMTRPAPLEVTMALRIAIGLTDALIALRASGMALAGSTFDGVMVDVTSYSVAVVDPRLLVHDRPDDAASRYGVIGTLLSALLMRAPGAIPLWATEDLDASAGVEDPRVHDQLCRLIKKLQSASNGYRSGRGIRHDLARCLHLAERHGDISAFPLGAKDTTSQFTVPDVLYGRSPELTQIREAYQRVARGGAELLLVSGPSGIGKTKLIETACQQLERARKIIGKFNQFGNDEPYATIVQALRQLFRGVLGGDESVQAEWRARLLSAIPANTRLLFGVLPELGALVGEQPAVTQLPPAETAARFQNVLTSLVCACASPDEPLVIVLDDMQWCDLATITFISSALKDEQVQYVLWVGAFRDNEVGPDHPIVTALRQNAAQQAPLHHITLVPLDRESIEELSAETLGCSRERAQVMGTFILDKTDGNPLFARTLLTSLHDQELIVFVPDQECWEWRNDATRSAELPGDIVALIMHKIESLSGPARHLLTVASCLGREFETSILLDVLGSSQYTRQEIMRGVDECVLRGLLSAAPEPDRARDAGAMPTTLTFTHDRVQQAAHNLASPDQAKAINLEVGRILLTRGSPPERSDTLFRVVGHLNAGRDLASGALRERLVELNLLAGKRAIVANAFAESSRFLQISLSLLPPDHWQSSYDLSFEIHLAYMQAESLQGNRMKERQLFHLLASRARTAVDVGKVHELIVSLETSRGEHRSALKHGTSGLRALGEALPDTGDRPAALAELVKTAWALRRRSTQSLLNLDVSGQQNSAILRLLVAMGPPAYLIDSDLMSILMMRIVRRSLSGGITNVSSYGFAGYGLILSGLFGRHRRAREFGMIASRMNERFSNKWLQPKIDLMNGVFILPWTDAFEVCEEVLKRGLTLCVENADFGHASYDATSFACVRYYRGVRLDDVVSTAAAMQMYTRQARDHDMTSVLKGLEQVCRCLRGETAGPTDLSVAGWSEADFAASLSTATTPVAVFFFPAMKIGALYLHGDYEQACALGRAASRLEANAFSNPSLAEYLFYYALSVLKTWDDAGARDKVSAWALASRALRQFERWADLCPANFEARFEILRGEVCRVRGRLDVLHHLNAAVESSVKHGRVHYEALASELAAQHCTATGQPIIGAVYSRAARDAYLRWGAIVKASQFGAGPDDAPRASAPGWGSASQDQRAL
ncbi:serine/threonine-protein kinase PknK [Sorangium cellulosum]|nr:serine/threonine-protein kinase [Sorangium cellulosum]